MIRLWPADGSITEGYFAQLTDREIVDKVASEALYAALFDYFTNHDAACRELFAEAERRGKSELYERGYKLAWY